MNTTLTRFQYGLISLLLLIGIQVVDFFLVISLVSFQIIPIALAAMNVGWRWSIFLTIWACIGGLFLDIEAYHQIKDPVVWTFICNSFIFATVAYYTNQLKITLEHEQQLARVDGLTGLANKRHFMDILELEVHKHRRYHKEKKLVFSLLFIDVDEFKQLNDTYGHNFGDKVLQDIATIIKQAAARNTDVVGRVGGDEFAVLLPETDGNGTKILCQRIVKRVDQICRDKLAGIHISVGAITFHTTPKNAESAIGEADSMMYLAKSNPTRHWIHRMY